MIVNINNVCSYCNLFILSRTSTLYPKVYSDFVFLMEAAVIANHYHDYCRHTDNGSHFCKSYYYIFIEKKITKFRSVNYINVLPCQKYPNILNDLTCVKKYLLFAVILIIKLISNKTGLTVSYYRI